MKKPNIVFILVDDMGYGDFSAFNGGLSSTPALDELMQQGTCLTQHYASSPVCNPSRASLLTGRYPHRTGSIDTLDWRGLDRMALREVTMADTLKGNGYATGVFGKWHLGALDQRYHPNNRGFDEFVGFRDGWQRYYDWNLETNFTQRRANGRYLTDVITDESVSFIERHKTEPFFLHVTYNAPHTPLECPANEVAPFVEAGKVNYRTSLIYGMISRMDKGVAQILDALKKHGLEENTIVVFTSDNGPESMDVHPRFNCHFNGGKGNVYEGGIRVPAIVRWPAGMDGSNQVNEMVHMTDWLPTLCEMAAVEPPKVNKLDGLNMLPLLHGEKGKLDTKRFWQWNRYTPLITSDAAMRDGDWKLVRPVIEETMQITRDEMHWNYVMRDDTEAMTDIIRTPEPPRDVPPPPPPELYNIADDPCEKNNLANIHPDRVSRMLVELETWFEDVEQEHSTIND